MPTLTQEPAKIYAGDTLAFSRTFADYPASDGWSLSYLMRLPGGDAQTFAGTPNGAAFDVTVAASTTAEWGPGTYAWVARVSKAGAVYVVGSGSLEVLPDPSSATPFDPRTHEQKCLDAIKAALEGRVGDPVVKYKIGDREAERIPPKELIRLKAHYQFLVDRQQGKAPGRVQVTFNGVV